MTDDTRNKVLSVLHKIERGVRIKQDEIYYVAQVPKSQLTEVINLIEGNKK